mmetsp:Transcript_8497/g.21784  ORF Transcript_8497/g.21784 Transcript_8497/m.21784 type:complete len:310 (+) Transcript_8497:776-1705(+)
MSVHTRTWHVCSNSSCASLSPSSTSLRRSSCGRRPLRPAHNRGCSCSASCLRCRSAAAWTCTASSAPRPRAPTTTTLTRSSSHRTRRPTQRRLGRRQGPWRSPAWCTSRIPAWRSATAPSLPAAAATKSACPSCSQVTASQTIRRRPTSTATPGGRPSARGTSPPPWSTTAAAGSGRGASAPARGEAARRAAARTAWAGSSSSPAGRWRSWASRRCGATLRCTASRRPGGGSRCCRPSGPTTARLSRTRTGERCTRRATTCRGSTWRRGRMQRTRLRERRRFRTLAGDAHGERLRQSQSPRGGVATPVP